MKCLAFLLLSALATAHAAEGWMKPGDVVATIGGEEMVASAEMGEMERALAKAAPDLKLRFRSLAWEGDTVYEQRRDLNYPALADQLEQVKATVVFAQFGQMESLEGAGRIGDFTAAYEKLLERIAGNPPRRVLLLLPHHFTAPQDAAIPDLTGHNDDVDAYADAIRALAGRKGVAVAESTFASESAVTVLTRDGIHLNRAGEALRAMGLAARLLAGTQEVIAPQQKSPGAERLLQLVAEKNRLWFNYYRPQNWAFLAGDRTNQPSSRDHLDPTKRWFPAEMEQYLPLIEAKEREIWAVAQGGAEPLRANAPEPPVEAPADDRNSPAAEFASFKLAEGFEINLFASEADGVVKPIQMRWDARGRLWVIGSRTYPHVRPGEEPNDQVLILEDTDGDGQADKKTVFADGFMIPTGLELDADGHGAWIGEGTKLWHLRDTDGDDRADSREVVLRGFGTGDNHQNLNSFRWSPGGDLLFCQGLHSFSRVETPRGIQALDEAGFWRLRPRALALEPFFGGKDDPQNPWGWVWTNFGQPLLVAGNNGGIFYPLPEMVPGHDEARVGNIWVNARSRKTSGPEIVGSAHWPAEWQGIFLAGGYMNNAVWALEIDDDGAGFRLTDRPPLVTSTHPSFRPIDVKAGPDGAIYLCDWYNPIIGHYQASFRNPDRDKTHGRIWRITAKGRPLVKQPPIAEATTPQLLENLRSPERWTREQSRRTLLARGVEAVQSPFDAWAAALPPGDAALFEAVALAESLDSPAPELLARLLRASTPDARAYAAGVVARWSSRLEDPLALLRPLVEDEHPRVRLAAVVALGRIDREGALELALQVAGKPMDRFLLSALHQVARALRPQWLPALQEGRLTLEPARLQLLARADGSPDLAVALRRPLGEAQLPAERRDALLLTLAELASAEDLPLLLKRATFTEAGEYRSLTHAQVLAKLLESLERGRWKLTPDLAQELPVGRDAPPAVRTEAFRLAGVAQALALIPAALEASDDSASTSEVRLAAIDALGKLRGREAKARLIELAGEGELPIRTAAIASLAQFDVAEAARQASGNLLAADANPEVVAALLPAFLARKEGSLALARALEQQSPPPLPALAQAMLQQLRGLGRQDGELVAVLNRFTGAGGPERKATPEFVQALIEEIHEKGDPKRGDAVFHRPELTCIACHSVGGQGGVIGPSLDAIGSGQPLDFIIGAVLEPQREVKESFEAVELTTKDGQIVQGYRVRENKAELVLRDIAQNRERTFRPADVAQRREIGSLMPSGLTDQLSREELRDLFSYLGSLGKPR